MTLRQSEFHRKQVDLWMRRSAHELSTGELLPLFEQALRAIHKRASITLSEVTMNAILDRALNQSQEAFPILSGMESAPNGISLAGLMANSGDFTPEQLTEAVQFLMVEILTILGNLTAGILTKPLHQELAQITSTGRAESQNSSRRLKSVKNADREDT